MLRSVWTRSEVLTSWGDVVGTTRHSTAVGAAASLGIGGEANATPGVAERALVTPSSCWGVVPAGTVATTVSGPLKPGPKPSASIS